MLLKRIQKREIHCSTKIDSDATYSGREGKKSNHVGGRGQNTQVLFWSSLRTVWIVQLSIVTSKQIDFKIKVQERWFWGGDLNVSIIRICILVKAMIREGEESKMSYVGQWR